MSNNNPFNTLTTNSINSPSSNKPHLVFVYGTLRRNHYNHDLISKADFLRDWVTPARYTMISFGFYPAVISVGATPIVGELYKVNDRLLERMDVLEGVPDFYQRDTIKTPAGEAFWYVMPEHKKDAVVVLSGDWEREAMEGGVSNA
jgi:gamma-glutamylcyclotransferase (GGCT)/AIG2-like uncharacterized protein YtfP